MRFVKQYDEYGLKAKTKLTGSGFMVESDTLPAQGKSALGAQLEAALDGAKHVDFDRFLNRQQEGFFDALNPHSSIIPKGGITNANSGRTWKSLYRGHSIVLPPSSGLRHP